MGPAMSTPTTVLVPSPQDAKQPRLVSLDQFRGYTVLGMLLVNYFGGYAVCPQVLRHTHDYCSYADTIMPHFLFTVGFALRLTFGRRAQSQGLPAAYLRIVRRLLGLILVSLVIYTVSPRAGSWDELVELGFWGAIAEPLKRGWFQTLMHIAVTSLWILPVVRAGTTARVLWMLGSAVLHVGLSYSFNFMWTNSAPNGIDGGPLGFLTWTIPAIVGTLACDWFVQARQSSSRTISTRESTAASVPRLWGTLVLASALMGLGWGISCGTRWYDVPNDKSVQANAEKLANDPVLPSNQRIAAKQATATGIADWLAEAPFVRPAGVEFRQWNYWMMSQRAGTVSYLTFAAGFSLAMFWLFYIVCDVWGWQLAVFRTFGTNALLAYVLHSLVSEAVQPFFPDDSPAWYAVTGLALFFLVNWIFVRHFEKQGIYLRA